MKKETKTEAPEETAQLVAFRVGSEEYGLDISAVAEVIRPLRITPLPRMPRFVEGVVNLRGVVIPVVDLRRRFELAEAGGDPRKVRMVITRGALPNAPARGQRFVGLVVDGACEVLTLPLKQIDAPPEEVKGPQADFITGMGKLGDRLIILLDIARILTREEREQLVEAQNGQS